MKIEVLRCFKKLFSVLPPQQLLQYFPQVFPLLQFVSTSQDDSLVDDGIKLANKLFFKLSCASSVKAPQQIMNSLVLLLPNFLSLLEREDIETDTLFHPLFGVVQAFFSIFSATDFFSNNLQLTNKICTFLFKFLTMESEKSTQKQVCCAISSLLLTQRNTITAQVKKLVDTVTKVLVKKCEEKAEDFSYKAHFRVIQIALITDKDFLLSCFDPQTLFSLLKLWFSKVNRSSFLLQIAFNFPISSSLNDFQRLRQTQTRN